MAWVAGILLWFVTLGLTLLAGICLALDWRIGYFICFALIVLSILASFVCVGWFFFERITGRVTPWRAPNEAGPGGGA